MGLFDFFKKKPTIPPEALTLWVHRQTQFEFLATLDESDPLKFIPLGGVFAATPALTTTDGPIHLRKEHLKALGMDFNEAFKTAMMNVGQQLTQGGKAEGLELYVWQGVAAASVAAIGRTLANHVSVKGTPVLMVPRDGIAFMVGSEDVEALTVMLDLSVQEYEGSPEFRSLRAVTWTGEALPVEWLPPEGHPLRTRFRTAAAKTRRHEAQGLHHLFAAKVAPLAHLAALENHGGVLQGSWVRDADVVMPRVDRVTLIDTDDQPLNRLDVDLETLLEVMAPAFDPLALTPSGKKEEEEFDLETARAFRMRGAVFPSLLQRRFLVQRMAFKAQSPNAEARDVSGAELLAAWDAGEPIVAEAAMQPGKVSLEAADRRVAEVTLAELGDRVSRLSPTDQAIFHNSFAASVMLRIMLGEEPDESELPQRPEGLDEQQRASRPTLMSSNVLRGLRENQKKEGGDDLGSKLMEAALDTWEPSQLFPAVRPPDYDEGKRANYSGMVTGALAGKVMEIHEPKGVTRSGPEGLRLDLVSDRGQQMMVLNGDLLPEMFLDPVWRSTELNLDAASLQPFKPAGDGRYVGPWHDSYDFARVLMLPKLLASCSVKGTPLVFAPTVSRVWVTGTDDLEGQKAVLDAIDAHLTEPGTVTPYQFRELLFGWPWTVKDGALVKWTVPAEHPLAARIAALDALLMKRRKNSRQHVEGFAQAHYSPLQQESVPNPQ
jgi:hypothetical protein